MEFLQLPPREALLYTYCFCEENIYKFIERHVSHESLRHYTVMFLSNSAKCIPVFSQRAQKDPVNPVLWDYHVILAYHPDHSLEELLQQSKCEVSEGKLLEPAITKSYIYDLDTILPTFPCPFPTYFAQTFSPPPSSLFDNPFDRVLLSMALSQGKFSRYFRLVPASAYLEYFCSGRVHMMNEDGTWKAPQPEWDVIRGEKASADTFDEYIDFENCEDPTNALQEGKEYLGIFVGEKELWGIFGGGIMPDVEALGAVTLAVPGDVMTTSGLPLEEPNVTGDAVLMPG